MKDERWAKQFGDFAETLTMYVLGKIKNMSVALIDHVGADIIAIKLEDTSKRYAISVKGRNIPPTESKSFNFSSDNIQKLSDTAAMLHMEPAVSFVFVDEMEGPKKIRMFAATLEDLKQLCNDTGADFVSWGADGITFRYTEGRNKHHLTDILQRKEFTYVELTFSAVDDTLSF